ncbi:MAG: hypothetical protein AB8G05_13125 [Oligoflexales bacterium]
MKHRCSIVLGILLLFFNLDSSLASSSYEISTDFSGQSSSTTLQDQISKPGQSVWSLGVKQESSSSPFELEANFSAVNRELDKFFIQEYDPNSPTPTVPVMRSLKDAGNTSEHLQGGLNLIYRKADLTNILGYSAPMSSDPLEAKKLSFSSSLKSNKAHYDLGIELSFSQAKQPKTLYRRFYEDEPYRQSPDFLYTQEYKLWFETSLTSKIKIGGEISNTNRSKFRPDVRGVKLMGRVALNDRIFTNLSIAQFKENESQEPLDDQGYFTLSYSELGFDFEPIFDLLVGLSYAYIKEIEEVATHGGENRELYSDQYGFALTHQSVFQDLGVKASIIRSEVGEIQRLFGGSITWRI